MEPSATPVKQSAPRRIVVTNDHFQFGNIEAWINIIRSYKETNPDHVVTILYNDEPIRNITSLFKMPRPIRRDAFQLVVSANDQNLDAVPKLYRLLVEGAGPDFRKFLLRDIHQVLKLF